MFSSPEDLLAAKQNRAVYASIPDRGLEWLIAAFREAQVDTRLDIYSGMRIYQRSDEPLAALYAAIAATPRARRFDPVGQTELAAAMKSAAFLTYPANQPETYCIVAQEAMAAGLKVIATPMGALRETTRGHADLMPLDGITGAQLPSLFARRIEANVQDFLARPMRWMRWISDHGGTGTAGPNFAFALAARTLRRTNEELDLSTLRIALSGAEPVDATTFERFFTAGERFGLRRSVAFPAFGMAEVCIAGVFPRLGDGLRTDWVDRVALETDRSAVAVEPGSEHGVELAILGRAVPGLEISIVDPDTGDPRGDREVGELLITGNSLTEGYYHQPEETAELIRDGWLHTGDLAYTVDGELVVCGRIKDLIIVGGRNIYPQDVEKIVGEIEGVRTGNVIAFGVDGRNGAQNMIVVAETKAASHLDELTRTIVGAVTEAVGIPPKDIVLVEPGTVPKTSSGKLQRSACRLQFQSGELARI
jgi:acyl-CoA synthetase (AMP-forming)/AMP-acid ligase II